jgi:uncharacterized Zn-finger protein
MYLKNAQANMQQMCSKVTTVVSGSFACVLIPAWSMRGTDLEVWCRGIHKEELLKYPHLFLVAGDVKQKQC